MATAPLITLTTDFGTQDGYTGALKGVILQICPEARIVDIAHDIPPQDIRCAAWTLRRSVPYFPANTIHVAVIDPGQQAIKINASGAGYYAMTGMPYDPVVQLSTPIARQSVMEGRTLAIAAFNSKLDDDFEIATTDPEERAAIEKGMADTAARIEADMDPVGAASRMDTDEVVPLEQLRPWLECLVESAWQAAGYRRTKNPRIWSVHDLEVLCGPR